MKTAETLNVAALVPFFKNQIVLNRFDHLSEGGFFLINNNTDPLPIYYRLLVERGSIFKWQYLKQGPELWEVRISKLKKEKASFQIREIVANDYRKVEVFKRFGIDIYSKGEKKIEQACQEKKIDIKEVEKALKEVENKFISPSIDFNKWEIDFLIDYIINTNHRFVAVIDPEIHEYLQKVAEVYAAKHFDIIDITRCFIKTSSELKQHLHQEEFVLFPYIKQMCQAKKNNSALSHPPFGSVAKLIQLMEREHNNMLYEMKEIEFTSNNFTVPEDADNTFHIAYAKLKLFWDELLTHIHLENNILFPKAIEMEKELLG